jgi:glycosyltransferase involved in cell wall biosynthesis
MVSIIVPNYNHSKYLVERLESIFNQTYQDYEVILLDDCSTDESWNLLQSYANHPKVSHIERNSQNSGSPFGLWEKGFSLAMGELIWIAESDDVAALDFLEGLVAKFVSKDIVLAHCRSNDFIEDMNYSKKNNWLDDLDEGFQDKDYIEDGQWLLKKIGRFKCPVLNVSSAIFRKDILKNIEIPKSYRYSGDWLFWAQLFMNGKIVYMADTRNYFRIHSGSATSSINSNNWLKLKEYTKVASVISRSVNEKFTFDTNYNWLLLYWKKAIAKEMGSGIYYSLKYLPLSFIIQIYKVKFK